MHASRLALSLVAGLGGLIATSGMTRAEDLVVRISFDQVFDRLSPTPKVTTTHKEIEAHLSGSGELRVATDSTSARLSSHREAQLKLGPTEEGQEWRVLGKDKLMVVARYISFKRAILLTVRGKTCTAQVDYELNPGFSDYRYHRLGSGDLAVARSAAAQNLACSVAGMGDPR